MFLWLFFLRVLWKIVNGLTWHYINSVCVLYCKILSNVCFFEEQTLKYHTVTFQKTLTHDIRLYFILIILFFIFVISKVHYSVLCCFLCLVNVYWIILLPCYSDGVLSLCVCHLLWCNDLVPSMLCQRTALGLF